MFTKPKKSQVEALRGKLADLVSQRQAIIEQSTATKLERLADKERELRLKLHDAERAEASVKSSSEPTQEEVRLWAEIRENMDREQDTLRQTGTLPARYIRPDAVAHFYAEVQAERAKFDAQVAGLRPHQSMGPRLQREAGTVAKMEQLFPQVTKPLCVAGEKIYALREQRKVLTTKRDELRQARETAALAAV